ncbi:MAG: cyclic nucleotide-binding domain-containing protein [Nitrospinae bacterium]|nr:cyclic nucleotide-binding domain-containing protein [Nitrospinota bacterium]
MSGGRRLEKDQLAGLIKDVSFFENFSREEMEFLASADCKAIRYLPSEEIISEGEADSALYVLLRGVIAITKNAVSSSTKRPGKVQITRLKPGSVFGEISLISSCPRTTSVLAEREAIVLKIEGKTLRKMDPVFVNKIQKRLIELLVARLDDMNSQYVEKER